MTLIEQAKVAIKAINDKHPDARVLAVGGFVRDKILGVDSKDLDLEVFGLTPDQIVESLEGLDLKVDQVGKSFGVIKVGDLDISVPRRERKTGDGHKGFDVVCDPFMSIEQAALRRDFTINAISMDLETGEIIDPLDGEHHLVKDKVLIHTSDAFSEDPLRVLRAVQFAGRFGLTLAPDTAELCRSIKGSFAELPQERIWGELEKLFTKGVDFILALRVLKETEWIEHFPEIEILFKTPQDPEWHPEGNVGVHTEFVMEEAAKIAVRDGLDEFDTLVLVCAALFHDIGKPDTTAEEERDGIIRIVSPVHDKVGGKITIEVLERLGAPNKVIEHVSKLVVEHMAHCGFKDNPSDRAVRRLANRLSPVSVNQWARIVESDCSGRPPLPKAQPVQHWIEIAEELNIKDSAPTPIMLGRHLIRLGLKPGVQFGEILGKAFEAQLDGEFDNEVDGLEWIKTTLDWKE